MDWGQSSGRLHAWIRWPAQIHDRWAAFGAGASGRLGRQSAGGSALMLRRFIRGLPAGRGGGERKPRPLCTHQRQHYFCLSLSICYCNSLAARAAPTPGPSNGGRRSPALCWPRRRLPAWRVQLGGGSCEKSGRRLLAAERRAKSH